MSNESVIRVIASYFPNTNVSTVLDLVGELNYAYEDSINDRIALAIESGRNEIANDVEYFKKENQRLNSILVANSKTIVLNSDEPFKAYWELDSKLNLQTKKIMAIKVVRNLTGLGLKDSKELVESQWFTDKAEEFKPQVADWEKELFNPENDLPFSEDDSEPDNESCCSFGQWGCNCS